MSFLGMSYLEILVIALVAFVFLGPERMVDMARKLGKMVGTVRAMAADLPSIEDLDLDGTRERARAGTRPVSAKDDAPGRSDEDLERTGRWPSGRRLHRRLRPSRGKEGAGLDSGLRGNDESASENRP